jgi:hypothetical protein
LQKFASAGCALVFDHLIESFQPFRDFLFRIRLRLQRKLQYSIVDFLRCHVDLCDLRADGCAPGAGIQLRCCEDSISDYFSAYLKDAHHDESLLLSEH